MELIITNTVPVLKKAEQHTRASQAKLTPTDLTPGRGFFPPSPDSLRPPTLTVRRVSRPLEVKVLERDGPGGGGGIACAKKYEDDGNRVVNHGCVQQDFYAKIDWNSKGRQSTTFSYHRVQSLFPRLQLTKFTYSKMLQNIPSTAKKTDDVSYTRSRTFICSEASMSHSRTSRRTSPTLLPINSPGAYPWRAVLA